MDTPTPFCEDCGTLGLMLSGVHPGDGGIVRWALYRCGHMKTEILLDEVVTAELLPEESRTT
jgi:hypothetical protein